MSDSSSEEQPQSPAFSDTATSPIDFVLSIDTRLSYRVGCPILPVLPLETVFNIDVPYLRSLLPQLHNILVEEKMVMEWGGLVKRYRKGENFRGINITLLIVSDVRVQGQYKKWKRTAERLQVALFQQSLRVYVEIIDASALSGCFWGPIREGDLLKGVWTAPTTPALQCSMRALRKVILRMPGVVAVHLLRRALCRPVSRLKSTYVVFARNADHEQWWDRVLPRLKMCLPKGWEVELPQDTNSGTRAKDDQGAGIGTEERSEE